MGIVPSREGIGFRQPAAAAERKSCYSPRTSVLAASGEDHDAAERPNG